MRALPLTQKELSTKKLMTVLIYVAPLNPPVENQKDDYFNYYRDENLISNNEDIALLKSDVANTEKIAKEKNINFNSGHVMIE